MENSSSPADPHYVHSARFVYVLNNVLTNVAILFGIVGNLLTIFVLSQKAMRSTTNRYLCALVTWDTVLLICNLFLTGLPSQSQLTFYNDNIYAYVASYVYPLALTAQTVTIWLTVSVTVERYATVFHRQRAAGVPITSICRANKVIFGVVLCATAYNVPRWFENRPRAVVHPGLNTTQLWVVTLTDLSRNDVYLQVNTWLSIPIVYVIPLLILCVLSTRLIMAVRRCMRQLRQHRGASRLRENTVTVMLVVVVFAFILRQVPITVYTLAFAIDRQYVVAALGFRVLSEINNFLVTINSAINFTVHYTLGQKFRRTFCQTFMRKCQSEIQGEQEMQQLQHQEEDQIRRSNPFLGLSSRSHSTPRRHYMYYRRHQRRLEVSVEEV